MIQTSLTNLILYNLCALLVVLGLMWAAGTVRTRVREYRRRRHEVVCGVCGHQFKNASRSDTVHCPACSRLVQRQRLLDV